MSGATYILYHANCYDGFASAYAAWKVLGESAKYIPVQHGDPLPKILDGSKVYILDFAYPRSELLALSDRASITVLDHHKTAIYGKDLIAQLAEACDRRKFPLGLYYSIADWHHPYYPNQGRHHELPPQPTDQPNWELYLEFLKNQVRELCTNYGEIHHFFWDMNVPQYEDPS